MKVILFLSFLFAGSVFIRCKCDCQSGDMNSITFTFSIGSAANNFTDAEVDTVVIYQLTKNTTTKLDSVTIKTKKFTLSESGIYFNGGSYWENDYLVKTQGNKDFVLSDFQVESGNDQSKCKCNVSITKKLKVNGVQSDLSGKNWSDSNILLTK